MNRYYFTASQTKHTFLGVLIFWWWLLLICHFHGNWCTGVLTGCIGLIDRWKSSSGWSSNSCSRTSQKVTKVISCQVHEKFKCLSFAIQTGFLVNQERSLLLQDHRVLEGDVLDFREFRIDWPAWWQRLLHLLAVFHCFVPFIGCQYGLEYCLRSIFWPTKPCVKNSLFILTPCLLHHSHPVH